MDNMNDTAALAVDSFKVGALRTATLKERLKDPARWKKSLGDVGMWFLFGGLLTTMLSMYSPGYPIIVGTASITPGLYWLDRQAFSFTNDSFVTFPFKPSQPWLEERYGDDRIFTKQVKGVAGDTIFADAQLRLKVCHVRYGGAKSCEDVGQAQEHDSFGRKMVPWVPANHQYTLRDGELWVSAPNPKSLDSRYYGPIRTSAVSGKATAIFYW